MPSCCTHANQPDTPPACPLPPAVDNQKRFAMFCRAAIEALRALPFMPGEDCLVRRRQSVVAGGFFESSGRLFRSSWCWLVFG